MGMRLRECLISFVKEVSRIEYVPEGTETPKQADVPGWMELIANAVAQATVRTECEPT